MSLTKEDALAKAQKDLAKRLNIEESSIKEKSTDEVDFPDMALGAGTEDEMSGQMLTRGWRIRLDSAGKTFEYRADKNQVRLFNFRGKNYKI